MNVDRQYAVVLQVIPSTQQKIIILDKVAGKITCFLYNKQLPIGAYIEYTPVQKRRHLVAVDVNVLYMPFIIARSDLMFLHHVLELCYHFIPEGIMAEDIFCLIQYLYKQSSLFDSKRSKKLYVSKLFVLFGMYPDKLPVASEYWNFLRLESIDRIIDGRLDLGIEKEITEWLRSCIMVHPLSHTFRTVTFLNESE